MGKGSPETVSKSILNMKFHCEIHCKNFVTLNYLKIFFRENFKWNIYLVNLTADPLLKAQKHFDDNMTDLLDFAGFSSFVVDIFMPWFLTSRVRQATCQTNWNKNYFFVCSPRFVYFPLKFQKFESFILFLRNILLCGYKRRFCLLNYLL